MKKTISFVLSIIMLMSVFFMQGISVQAASEYTVTVKTGEYVQLYNVGAGLPLNVSGNKSANNTNINVYKDDGTSGYWFKPGEKDGKYYFVPKCATSSAVNVYGNSAKDGANVCVWKLSKSSTQLWVVEYNEKHKGFILRCADNTDLVLTACGSSSGSNVCVQKYDSSNKYQIWTSSAFSVKKNETTKYKVTFDGNGGKASKSSETAAANTTIKLPSASRSGYTFLGWSTSKTARTATYESGDSYKVTKKITLYAVWQKNDTKKYTVTFKGNGGKVSKSKISAAKNSSITLPSASRSGYTFLGWSTSKSAKTATYKSGTSYKVTKDVKLYAVWQKNPTIYFDGNGGKASVTNKTVEKDSSVTLPKATKTGYVLLGWSTSKSATSATYKEGSSYKVTKDITLYAVWAKACTVTFNGNGGTADKTKETAGKNTSISLPGATRDGYSFLGWSTSSSAKSAMYKSGASYKVTKNITLYAVWEEIKMVSPVNNRKLTSPFQPYYRHDFNSNYGHGGVDYVSNNNDRRIMAFFDGKVTKIITKSQNKSTGNLIEIKHTYKGKTFYSYYWHLADGSIKVKVGDTVKAGTVIATMGKTGTATGVHLHFQITDKSCVNSDKSVHVPKRDNSKKNMTKAQQAKIEVFVSHKGITFYNPDIVLKKGIEVIVGS